MIRTAFVLLCVLGLGVAAPAGGQSASSIVAAKSAGQVGERFDGYLGYVSRPAAAVTRQVEAVNIRRRALYSGLASRRGVSPQEVGITAGCQTLARVRVGEYYLAGDNVWRRRGAGQAAPVPDYCGG